MGLVVVAAGKRDVRQARPLVRDEAAGAFKSKHTGGGLGCNSDRFAKTVTEMPPAIADFIREALDRDGPVRFPQSLPCPGDFRPLAGWAELRQKRLVQHGEPFSPSTGREQRLDQIPGAVSPDIGEIQD